MLNQHFRKRRENIKPKICEDIIVEIFFFKIIKSTNAQKAQEISSTINKYKFSYGHS